MTRFTIDRRRMLGSTGLGVLAAPAILSGHRQAGAQTAQAGAEANKGLPMDHAMPPEISRFKLGEFEVVAIRDGFGALPKPNETFGTDQAPDTVAALLDKNFLPTDQAVNSYAPVLVNTGSELVLFDTGFGEGGRQKGTGRLIEGLAAAGYTREDVSLVVLTHLHGDHIGGLMERGQPAFPNARYITGQIEYDFWTNEARVGTPAEGGHKGVLANVKPLAEKMTFINDGADVVSGITATLAAGHTPGMMVFDIESAGKRLVLTADTANHYVLSLQKPDWQVRFDMDKAKAAETRRKVFDRIAADKVAFTGYHMPFPAVGFVEKFEDGYRFVPKSYQFDL